MSNWSHSGEMTAFPQLPNMMTEMEIDGTQSRIQTSEDAAVMSVGLTNVAEEMWF